jgi:hypothetical protein
MQGVELHQYRHDLPATIVSSDVVPAGDGDVLA